MKLPKDFPKGVHKKFSKKKKNTKGIRICYRNSQWNYQNKTKIKKSLNKFQRNYRDFG